MGGITRADKSPIHPTKHPLMGDGKTRRRPQPRNNWGVGGDKKDFIQLNASADQVTTAPMVTAVAVFAMARTILLLLARLRGGGDARIAKAAAAISVAVAVEMGAAPSIIITTSLAVVAPPPDLSGSSVIVASTPLPASARAASTPSSSPFSSVSSRFRFNDVRTGV